MKKTKYVCIYQYFDLDDKPKYYSDEVYCFGLIQAYFLFVAKAIENGKSYQPYKITDEDGNERYCEDIMKFANSMFK